MPTCRKRKTGLERWKWRPYKVRLLLYNSIYAKKDRNDLPSANQVISTVEPMQIQPCSSHPSGAPTHLRLSCPFCWIRIYLWRTLLEVTSRSWESHD